MCVDIIRHTRIGLIFDEGSERSSEEERRKIKQEVKQDDCDTQSDY